MQSVDTKNDAATLPVRCAVNTGEGGTFLRAGPLTVLGIDAQQLQNWVSENDNIDVARHDCKGKRIHGDQTPAGVQSNSHRALSLLDHEHPAIRHLELPRVRHAPHNLHIRKCRLQLFAIPEDMVVMPDPDSSIKLPP